MRSGDCRESWQIQIHVPSTISAMTKERQKHGFVPFFDKIEENWKELKIFGGDFESYKVEQITVPELCQPTNKD